MSFIILISFCSPEADRGLAGIPQIYEKPQHEGANRGEIPGSGLCVQTTAVNAFKKQSLKQTHTKNPPTTQTWITHKENMISLNLLVEIMTEVCIFQQKKIGFQDEAHCATLKCGSPRTEPSISGSLGEEPVAFIAAMDHDGSAPSAELADVPAQPSADSINLL